MDGKKQIAWLTLAISLSLLAWFGQSASGGPTWQGECLGVGECVPHASQFGYFPRVQSPEGAQPKGSIAAENARERTREALGTLDQTLFRAIERFGERVPLFDHPYLGGMSAHQWKKFHWRHTVHHMRQVRERARFQA